jgi:hypothetical protein
VYYIRNFEPNETLEGHYISWLKFWAALWRIRESFCFGELTFRS